MNRANQRTSNGPAKGPAGRPDATTTAARAGSVEISCPPAHLENKWHGSASASSSWAQESICGEGPGAPMNRKQPAFRIHWMLRHKVRPGLYPRHVESQLTIWLSIHSDEIVTGYFRTFLIVA
jgi:hypothetical protein